MIWCLSNARSRELHFGISFIALRALVREIIPNTIPSHIHTSKTPYVAIDERGLVRNIHLFLFSCVH